MLVPVARAGCQARLRLVSSVLFLTFPLRAMSSSQAIWRCDFEVFGIVQGVFFRKYTQGKATELGLKGWCQNTSQGTVVGVLEGEEGPYRQMKDWLERTGSPQSRIDKAVFKDERKTENYTFSDFSIKR